MTRRSSGEATADQEVLTRRGIAPGWRDGIPAVHSLRVDAQSHSPTSRSRILDRASLFRSETGRYSRGSRYVKILKSGNFYEYSPGANLLRKTGESSDRAPGAVRRQ